MNTKTFNKNLIPVILGIPCLLYTNFLFGQSRIDASINYLEEIDTTYIEPTHTIYAEINNLNSIPDEILKKDFDEPSATRISDDSIYWEKIILVNTKSYWHPLQLEYKHSNQRLLDAYSFNKNEKGLPLIKEYIKDKPFFRLNVPPRDTQIILVKFVASSEFPTLFLSHKNLIHNSPEYRYLSWLFFLGTIVLLIFSCILYLPYKAKIYRYYILYLGLVLMVFSILYKYILFFKSKEFILVIGLIIGTLVLQKQILKINKKLSISFNIGMVSVFIALLVFVFLHYVSNSPGSELYKKIYLESWNLPNSYLQLGMIISLIATSIGIGYHNYLNNSFLRFKAVSGRLNDHFLGNVLNTINHLVEEGNSKEASYYLTNLFTLTQNALDSTEEDLIPLKKELETCEAYIGLMQKRFPDQINFQNDLGGIDLEKVKIPPFSLQTILENSCKHGRTPKRTLDILLKIEPQNKIVKCTIDDNGIGRKAAQAKATSSIIPKERSSMGLKFLKENLRFNKMKYKEIDKQSPDAGFRFEIYIPIKNY